MSNSSSNSNGGYIHVQINMNTKDFFNRHPIKSHEIQLELVRKHAYGPVMGTNVKTIFWNCSCDECKCQYKKYCDHFLNMTRSTNIIMY